MSGGGRVLTLIVVAAGLYGVVHHRSSRPGEDSRRRPLYYVDPMHPSYKSDKPGVAPDCGMALAPVYANDLAAASHPAGAVSIDSATRRMMGIRVARVSHSGITRPVRTVGRVIPEDSRIYRINSGVDGIVRDTYNDSLGTVVRKGQKLAAYYAPDFLAASSGFLAANERLPGTGANDGARTMPFPGALSKQGQGSIQGYMDRLRNLGMSDGQMRRMAETRLLQESIDIVSPADGVILARNLSTGQHFEHNMEFYRIADLTRVWITAEVSEEDVPFFHAGDRAQIKVPGLQRYSPAHITDSLPQSEGGGTVKLRLEVENPLLLLRPEMVVDVELSMRLPVALTVPADALVDSGERSRVYVESADGSYEPREVETGWRFGGQVEIREGIRADDRVVVGATFLVDSESRLQAPSSGIGAAPAEDMAKLPAPAQIRTTMAKSQ